MPYKILHIEDDPSTQLVMGNLLPNKFNGLQYEATEYGEDGIDMALNPKSLYDMIICDGDVEGEINSARDIIPAIRAGGLDIPILMLSAHVNLIQQVQELNAQKQLEPIAFMTKPYKANALYQQVHQMLSMTPKG